MLSSTYTEKLLGLHINADLKWNSHIDEISSVLRKRIGILKRIKQKVPAHKLSIIADAIFNSVIRYGIAVYLLPTYEKEDLKARKLSSETESLQVMQNNMLRTIHGLRIKDRVIRRWILWEGNHVDDMACWWGCGYGRHWGREDKGQVWPRWNWRCFVSTLVPKV